MKNKLSFKEQVEFFNNKNIIIDINNVGDNINQTEVFKILKERNYFFKFKTFNKCYEKNNNGVYKNLDFKSLHRFGILDTSFRSLVLELSLICEHLLKTKINYLCTTNNQDDGYISVKDFLNNYVPNELKRYYNGKKNYYTESFMTKYSSNFAVWNLLEILTFSETLDFYNFYINKYYKGKDLKQLILNELYAIKNLRNAAAHNNCILYLLGDNLQKLGNKYTDSNNQQSKGYSYNIKYILYKNNMNDDLGREFLLHDFLCLVYVFNKLCPKGKLKKLGKKSIKNFFIKCEKKVWFKIPRIVKYKYLFIKKATRIILK
ncbi:Abi family protein [Campylobacter sp. RM12640]|uniref:Abi family protein n=1 Tax=unclassified Campylobacter TaxID=2593542 RepID=UPI001E01838D|nr:Abi family protein [Campylobacter sp. RM12642]MBZ7982435.1 Abi family protein [Campylobacter sp. RM12640]MBZ7990059.1 Abi family protein [Campylobacter sp. RM12635]MBZ8008247.1 Abi family protein [Campylobacter sp. RM9334]